MEDTRTRELTIESTALAIKGVGWDKRTPVVYVYADVGETVAAAWLVGAAVDDGEDVDGGAEVELVL